MLSFRKSCFSGNYASSPNASSSSPRRSSVRDRWRKEGGKRSLKLIREATSIFKRDFPGRVWGSTAVLIFLEARKRANRSFLGSDDTAYKLQR